MPARSVIHSTFVLERDYPASPERVFTALSDPANKRRWFAEGEGFEVVSFTMDFRVGGSEQAEYRFKPGTPFPGAGMANHTTYLDIVANERIVLAYTMIMGEQRISSSLATFELLPTEAGTRLVFTEQAAFFAGADGPEMRQAGWTSLLDRLVAEL